MTMTIGKARGLQTLLGPAGVFTITALDHRGSLKRALSKAVGREVVFDDIVAEKVRLCRALAPHSTAVLLDPVYGAGPCIAAGAVPPGCGLLVALEESGYDETEDGRLTTVTPGWSVEKIKRMGAAAVKVLLFYHPDNDAAPMQEAFVREVAKATTEHDIAFLLEPMSYPLRPDVPKHDAAFATTKPAVVLETVRRLGDLGADVLKLEFPFEPGFERDDAATRAAVRALTDASPVPWVLLSEGKDFDTFQRQVEIACREGASGFLGGRAIWQEMLTLPDAADRDRFLHDVAVPRLRILTAIAEAYGRPFVPEAPHASVYGWHGGY